MTNARPNSGPKFLEQHVGKLKSRMGGFVPGSYVSIRGVDLHETFNNADWMDLYVFGITGRRLSAAQLKMLQALWTYTSYPDARLWNNRVAALAGSARSSGTLGVAAALAVSEATIYGRGVDIRAITFLQNTRKAIASGGNIAECVREELDECRSIAGYGRPLTSEDERLKHARKLARQLELDRGPHLLLANEIDSYLANGRWRMKMNYAGLAAALAADIGFSPREYYFYAFGGFLAGMLPCHIEALADPEGALFPVPCRDIRYQGASARSWG